jgi:urea transport system substrate-binding protein
LAAGLLFYPVQYEGLESSPDIYYTGAEPTEQIVPAVTWLLKQNKKKIFLLGSDYVFPRTANKIIKAQLAAMGGTCVGEEYTPLGATEYSTIISKIKAAHPDAVFNTLNGDSNVAFFKQLKDAGITAAQMPVMSVSVAEVEAKGIGPSNIAGDYCAWNYFETLNNPINKKFVAAYKAAYGPDQVTDDPIEAGYFGVYLWKEAVEKAGSTDVDAVLKAANGISFNAPEGLVTIDGANHHTWKTPMIGQFRPDGLINVVWKASKPVEPDPYLLKYPWAKGITTSQPTPVSVMEK